MPPGTQSGGSQQVEPLVGVWNIRAPQLLLQLSGGWSNHVTPASHQHLHARCRTLNSNTFCMHAIKRARQHSPCLWPFLSKSKVGWQPGLQKQEPPATVDCVSVFSCSSMREEADSFCCRVAGARAHGSVAWKADCLHCCVCSPSMFLRIPALLRTTLSNLLLRVALQPPAAAGTTSSMRLHHSCMNLLQQLLKIQQLQLQVLQQQCQLPMLPAEMHQEVVQRKDRLPWAL